jgi:hypothetical protein
MNDTIRLFGGALLFSLAACNFQEPQDVKSGNPDEDHSHEKSFSWNTPARAHALARTAALRTRFETEEALASAIQDLDEQLKSPAFSDNLWKPIDHACDELALAAWNTYGTLSLGDSIVFDEQTLKADCRYIGGDSGTAPAGLAKAADDFTGAVVDDRQFPYKMIGESWDDFNIGVYKSTGGETQFKKRRERYGVMGWYDTDASRIGVRIYLLNCSTSGPKTCYVSHSQKDWYSNDDYVSKRDYGVGLKVKFTRPTPENNWTMDPKGVGLIDFKVSDAVITMHSADHAGLQFRAQSSSGFASTAQIVPHYYDYVTW